MAAAALAAAAALQAQNGASTVVVVNASDAASREIGAYYRVRRSIPAKNVCEIRATSAEEIDWETYLRDVERPLAACLEKNGLRESTLYIATTLGAPLK